MIHPAAMEGFDRFADAYDRARPEYPQEAIDRIVSELRLGPGSTVFDLAAGTGKLTRPLVATGARVLSIEPVARMRDVLVSTTPGAEALDGTAEAIPLPPQSADAVTVGQAFHWFDGDRALAEIDRVLRPAGRLALIWNVRDATQALQARLSELLEPYRRSTPSYRSARWKDAFPRSAFVPSGEWHIAHGQQLDSRGLVDQVASISFVGALPVDKREELLAAVRALADEQRDDGVVLDYRTGVYVYERGA
jgi:ubiquinone/menaquinone biosynthesis C-methylase UbiE